LLNFERQVQFLRNILKKRKWNDDYIGHGSTFMAEKDGMQRPQSILCNKDLLMKSWF